MFIFRFMKNHPKTWAYRGSQTGYINEDIFRDWFFQLFLKHCKASPQNPVLLIMDLCDCHISLEIAEMAIENNVHIVLLPPHSSHFLQPCDMIFSILKDEFADLCQVLNLWKPSVEV